MSDELDLGNAVAGMSPQAFEAILQFLWDQRSDDPPPGGWNDAIYHVAEKLQEARDAKGR